MLKLESTRTVLEYSNDYAKIWLEIYEDNPTTLVVGVRQTSIS